VTLASNPREDPTTWKRGIKLEIAKPSLDWRHARLCGTGHCSGKWFDLVDVPTGVVLFLLFRVWDLQLFVIARVGRSAVMYVSVDW
jgi:hypothetical protein